MSPSTRANNKSPKNVTTNSRGPALLNDKRLARHTPFDPTAAHGDGTGKRYASTVGITQSRPLGIERTTTPIEPRTYMMHHWPGIPHRPHRSLLRGPGNMPCLSTLRITGPKPRKIEPNRNANITDCSKQAGHTHGAKASRRSGRSCAAPLAQGANRSGCQTGCRIASPSGDIKPVRISDEWRRNTTLWAEGIETSKRTGGCVETLAVGGTVKQIKGQTGWNWHGASWSVQSSQSERRAKVVPRRCPVPVDGTIKTNKRQMGRVWYTTGP